MKEETIAYNLEHAKNPKEKTAYNDIRVKLENKGETSIYPIFMHLVSVFFCNKSVNIFYRI